MLHFLWRWKCATTSALHRRFFADREIGTTYQRLWKLEKTGVIRSLLDPTGVHRIWVLDKRGFHAIKDSLPPLKEEGYMLSNWGHDLLASAIHYGEGVQRRLPHLEYCTEQHLRRLEPEVIPTWVPKLWEYRPDGFWRAILPSGPRIIGLEVELTQKRALDYKSLGWKFDYCDADIMLWVVPRESLAKMIHSLVSETRRKKTEHNFVLLDPVIEKGWQAPVVLGSETGKTINELLGNIPSTDPEPVFTQFTLDTRKRAYKSRPPRIFRPI